MDLITRKEFDVKCEMLTQSQLRIKELERRIGELEGKDTKTTGKTRRPERAGCISYLRLYSCRGCLASRALHIKYMVFIPDIFWFAS